MANNKLAPPSRNALLDAYYGNPNLAAQGRRMNLPARQMPGPFQEFATQAMSLDPQPDQGFGTMAAEMALGFVPGVGQAMAARDIERARRDNDPLGMGLAATSFVPFGKLIGALRGGKQMGPVSELITYHGSPHRFPPTAKNPLGEFDLTKIGTGEGAQAYGHGAGYLAEAKEVGTGYAKTLGIQRHGPGYQTTFRGEAVSPIRTPNYTEVNPEEVIRHAHEAYGLAGKSADQKAEAVIKISRRLFPDAPLTWEDKLDKLARATKKEDFGTKAPGYLYKVDLPDAQIAKMLDWDKPLSQQSQHVQDVVAKMMQDKTSPLGSSMEHYTFTPEEMQKASGRFLYDLMGGSDVRNFKKSSQRLSELGIPGIRYLDQGSRAGGKGTSNFVVFDPKHMNIIGRE